MLLHLFKCDRSILFAYMLVFCFCSIRYVTQRNNYVLRYLEMNFCPINTCIGYDPLFFARDSLLFFSTKNSNDACRLKIRRFLATTTLPNPLPPSPSPCFCPSPRSRRSLIHIIHSHRLVTSSPHPCPSRIPQSIRL